MSEHDLNTPGGMIASRREERKLSLADLSESTKIPAPVLEAIEHNEFHKVSGALYIKSFLRTCASYLGLEEEEVLAKYAQFSGEFDAASATGEGQWREEDVQISRIGLPWRLIGIVGTIIVAILLVVLFAVKGCSGGSDAVRNNGSSELEVTPESVAAEMQRRDTQESEVEQVVVTNDEMAEKFASVGSQEKEQSVFVRSGRDSLSRSFESSPEPKKAAVEIAKTEPAELPAMANENRLEQTGVGATAAIAGNKNISFSGGEPRAVVLRILCERQVGIEVKRDAERTYSAVQWPRNLNDIASLPLQDIDPGRPYQVVEGFVIYWGAADHFSLKLSGTQGVIASLNGVPRDVSRLKPGGELVLDLHGN